MFKTIDNITYIENTNDIVDNNPNIIAYNDMIHIADIDGNDKMDVFVNNKILNIRWEFDKILKRK
jgi:hypothetical protein